MNNRQLDTEGEMNLVEIWLRRDPTRWVAGALAGAFAGVVMMAFAAILSVAVGVEALYPLKVAALPILGGGATAFEGGAAVILGFIVNEVICMILGVLYAHFTGTNSLSPLLAMGLVWGIFTWIFIYNLFINSFKAVFAAHLPSGAMFFVALVFGVSLASVAFFDRALRGRKV